MLFQFSFVVVTRMHRKLATINEQRWQIVELPEEQRSEYLKVSRVQRGGSYGVRVTVGNR
jgi:hypothetical protein